MKKKQLIALLITLLLAPSISCTSQNASRMQVKNNTETLVVIKEADKIKAQEGIAVKIKELNNLKGLEWLDNNTVFAYKPASKVFGDDKGLILLNIEKEKITQEIPYHKPIDDICFSPDRSRFIATNHKTGTDDEMTFYNLKNNTEKIYTISPFAFKESFSWNNKNEGILFPQTYDPYFKVWIIDSNGDIVERQLKHSNDSTTLDYAQVYKTNTPHPMLYFLFYTNKTIKLQQYELETNQFKVIVDKDFSAISVAPDETKIAALINNTAQKKQTLEIYTLDGQLLYTLCQTNTIPNFKWSDDSKLIAFTQNIDNNKMGLYLADLETKSTHFVAEYPYYSIETISFSPDNKRLLINYKDPTNPPQNVLTHIIDLK